MNFIKDRRYLYDHPLAAWVALGAFILGALISVSPALGEGSSGLAILPPVGVVLWGLAYFLGGAFSLYGIFRRSPRFESAGMSLLGTALVVSFLSVLIVRGSGAALSVVFILTLALGCLSRAWFITHPAVLNADEDPKLVKLAHEYLNNGRD